MRALAEDGFWNGIYWGMVMMGIVLCGLIACADGRPSLTTAIRVWHDDQRLVTCWVAEGKDSDASIFCIPDAQLPVTPR
jgi:hypothetical protein